jgi:Ca2+-binding RTX toxin-like protein
MRIFETTKSIFVHVADDGNIAPDGTVDRPIATNGDDHIRTGSGNDIVYAGDGNDVVHTGAGRDTVYVGVGDVHIGGGLGRDTFYFGADLTSSDVVHGNGGNDTCVIDGDYSAGVDLAWRNFLVDNLVLESGHTYKINLKGDLDFVDASRLGPGDSLQIVSEDNRAYRVMDGAGDDVIIGFADVTLKHGGADHVEADHILVRRFDPDMILRGRAVEFDGHFEQLVIEGQNLHGSGVLLDAGHDYDIQIAAGYGADSNGMGVDASALSAANHLTFDGHFDPNRVRVVGGSGDDAITTGTGGGIVEGGSGADHITISKTDGNNYVDGGDGNDVIDFTAGFDPTVDSVAGGRGRDTFLFNTDASSRFSGGMAIAVGGVEKVVLENGALKPQIAFYFSAAGAQHKFLTVDGSSTIFGHELILLAGASDDSTMRYKIIGGAGGDTISGAAGNDVLEGNANPDSLGGLKGDDVLVGGLGGDVLTGGEGADTFRYNSAQESFGKGPDAVDFDFASGDRFDLPGHVTGIDAVIIGVGKAALDDDLIAAVDATKLHAHHAALFAVSSAAAALNQFYLVVDANGVLGYQSAQDFAFRLNVSHDIPLAAFI